VPEDFAPLVLVALGSLADIAFADTWGAPVLG
jgi:hypothetical protein